MTAAEPAADLYTIGHSTRTLQELIDALKSHGVDLLVDVRTAPRSRHVPQFNTENLAQALPSAGIQYVHVKELGGWRKAAPDSPNTGLRSPGFRGYADYLLTPEGQAALDRLIEMSRVPRAAVMCAEALPFRCHRSIIADALAARGLRVEHIMGPRELRPHRLNAIARLEANGRVTYPAAS